MSALFRVICSNLASALHGTRHECATVLKKMQRTKHRHQHISRSLFAIGLSLSALGLTHCSSDDSAEGAGGQSGSAGAPAKGGAGAGTGGDGAAGASSGGAGGEASSRFEQFFAGEFVRKVIATPNATEYFVLLERAGVLHVDYGHPRRRLVKVSEPGEVQPWIATLPWSSPGSDVSLLDFALHPSGESTALFASTAGYHLVRIDSDGQVISETPLSDPEIPLDAPSCRRRLRALRSRRTHATPVGCRPSVSKS